ncbi:MAG TPA: hypothetical protein VGW32_06300, partial [Pyrinomonadaceae bacterium]|nr:hypothetical protein [Pyrinomonadaceae bacterium]
MKRFVFYVVTLVLLLSGTLSPTAYSQTANGSKVGASAKTGVTLALPLKDGSVKFAVIGDTGTGTSKQHDVGDTMARYRSAFPFE